MRREDRSSNQSAGTTTLPAKERPRKWRVLTLTTISAVCALCLVSGLTSGQEPGGEPGETKPSCWDKTDSSLSHGYSAVDKANCNGTTICMKYTCEGEVDCTASGNTGCNWCLVGFLYKKVNGYYQLIGRNEQGSGVVNCGDTKSISGQFFDAQPKGSELAIQFKVFKKCDPDLSEMLKTDMETFTVQ